ncbi:MAG: class I SAM-dependent methyltransferase [Herminiimonas sp.]|nr:class I SAM-dependent methyltransferase [Herminiimonas sp.]
MLDPEHKFQRFHVILNNAVRAFRARLPAAIKPRSLFTETRERRKALSTPTVRTETVQKNQHPARPDSWPWPPAQDNATLLPADGAAFSDLLAKVAASGYRFTTPTPATHQRYLNNRGQNAATSLRDIFGWNLPFDANMVSPALYEAMHGAGVLDAGDSRGLLRSSVRIASLDGMLLLHSAFPTTQADAVFFGPDTYRFARFIDQALQQTGAMTCTPRILDVGCGSGAGGLFAARALHRRHPQMQKIDVVMNDINSQALRFTAINAAHAGIAVTLAPGDALAATTGQFDLIISNPPYMQDAEKRAYRDGGEGLGRALSVRIAEQALQRLTPGGVLLLYTGVAMTAAQDPFLATLQPLLKASGCHWSYAEIDPDVFGEELERPDYAQVERIAAVGLVASRALACN